VTRTATIRSFINDLSGLCFENTFNPYTDNCPDCDLPNAASVRKRNLFNVLEAAMIGGVDSLWVARDLGYRGGRRTGLALTDEINLQSHSELLRSKPLHRATKGPAVGEKTAAVVWRMLLSINRPIFLWNVFPLHPFEDGDPMTNRCHTREERQASEPLLSRLVQMLRPRTIVAIGRDAQFALTTLGMDSIAVRHPSRGGQNKFTSELQEIYRNTIAARQEAKELFCSQTS